MWTRRRETGLTIAGIRAGVFAAVCLLALSTPAAAQWQFGDVFASVGNGQVFVYRTGSQVATLNTGAGGFTTGGAFDASGMFYVTNFSNNTVYKFDQTGTQVGSFSTGGSNPESIVFNLAGNMYVGHAGFGNTDIRLFTAGGTQLATYNVATEDRGSDWIDLGADQHTMFYTSEGGRVLRYDVGTSTQRTDFASIGGTSYALRLIGAGTGADGLLVANQENGVRRLDGTGSIVQTYDVAGDDGFFALNRDPDGTSFWTGSFQTADLYRFDIASGTLLQTISTGVGEQRLFGVTVFGEITAGGGGVGVVPEPGTFILLGTGLLSLAGAARRRRKAMEPGLA